MIVCVSSSDAKRILAKGIICGFVFIEAGGGAIKNISDVGYLEAGESVGEYFLTSGVDGYEKWCVRDLS